MKKQTVILGLLGLLAISIIVSCNPIQNSLQLPTAIEAGVSFQTVASTRSEGSVCLNQTDAADMAKQMLHLRERMVVIGFGDNEMPDEVWADYNPRLPWLKNLDRHLLFDESCFYRSPSAPADCEGEACRVTREVAEYEWVDLSRIVAQDCLPTADSGCTAIDIQPGAIDIKVTNQCHQLIFEDEIYELADPAGNRYVMHATATGTPDLNPNLPDGWTLTTVTLDEPLEVMPFGGGDECYHNILQDNLGQSYHQYLFVEDSYPVQPPVEKMLIIVGNRTFADMPATITIAGGQYGEGEAFTLEAGQEMRFELEPDQYQYTWRSSGGSGWGRNFVAVGGAAVITWIIPEEDLIFSEVPQGLSTLTAAQGVNRGDGEVILPSVTSTESPFIPPEGQSLLVMSNRSLMGLPSTLTIYGERFGEEGREITLNPNQVASLALDPGEYRATWSAPTSPDGPLVIFGGEFEAAPDRLAVFWIVPEESRAFVQAPGTPGRELEPN